MKIEYDPRSDLLYVNFAANSVKAARTETVAPGVHIDFDRDGKVIGIEVLDASEVIGTNPQVELALGVAS
jgi:uncharacterized protein YuzE